MRNVSSNRIDTAIGAGIKQLPLPVMFLQERKCLVRVLIGPHALDLTVMALF
jgi:hypothetical protein